LIVLSIKLRQFINLRLQVLVLLGLPFQLLLEIGEEFLHLFDFRVFGKQVDAFLLHVYEVAVGLLLFLSSGLDHLVFMHCNLLVQLHAAEVLHVNNFHVRVKF